MLLHEAAFTGDLEYLGKHISSNNVCDVRGFSLLHQATSAGNLECIKFLLNNGFRIDINNNRFSALHIACLDGKIDVVKVFIDKGVNLNLLESGRHGCLHLATMRGHFDIVKLLIDSGIQLELEFHNLVALLVPKTILYQRIQPIKEYLVQKSQSRAILVDRELSKLLPFALCGMPVEIIELIRRFIIAGSHKYLVNTTTSEAAIGYLEKKSLLENSKIKDVFQLLLYISQ